jgi:predicted ATPase
MAAFLPAGLATGVSRMDWALEQRFPKPSARPDSLNQLQSVSQDAACAIYCGDQRLIPAENASFKLLFRIEPNPLQRRFVLDLRWGPERSQTNVSASFSAYDDLSREHRTDRVGLNWQGTHGNVGLSGPLDFSRQLYQVLYSTGADEPTPPFLFPGYRPADQLNFSWRTDTCARYNFGTPRDNLPADTLQAIDQFRTILDLATQGGRLGVLVQRSPRIPWLFWPWFCCQPVPSPESWWPWLRPLNPAEPDAIMDFSSALCFELDTAYVNKALSSRKAKWWETGREDVNNVPQPLVFDQLPVVTQFTDHREYLAHVLGSHGYEDVNSKNTVAKYFNGDHQVDVYPDDGGSMKHILLLNIRAPNASDGETLPEPGERVTVSITMDVKLGEETWTGRVIRIPAAFERHGRNVAVEVSRPPVPGGRILAHQQKHVHVFFGHFGQLCGKMRLKIIEVMTSGDSFWKSWLLAQDNRSLDNTARTDDLPAGWQKQVDAACQRAQLNPEQVEAVRSYFQRKVTIVIGPPGTGKSTLVDVIVGLEEAFANRFWVCTDSNAGVDVLAKKICARHRTDAPRGFFRLRTAFDERFVPEVGSGDLAGQRALPTNAPVTPTADEAIRQHLSDASTDGPSLPMAMESTIHSRMVDILDKNGKSLVFPDERRVLKELREAVQEVIELRRDGDVVLEGEELKTAQKEEHSARERATRKLQVVQSAYVKKSRGIFSTCAASSGPLLSKFAPHSLIMDEASQFMEANAVYPILHANANGQLRRVLIIGDHHQLPPTVLAERNPFSASGSVSLMERQIHAGTAHIQLRTQFRMHPSISRVVNTVSYGGSLLDGPITQQRPEVAQFKEFARAMATASGVNPVVARQIDTCSLVFCPAPFPAEFPNFGSQNMPGSTSKYNLQSAMMVFRTVYWLITKGGFTPQQILVTAFYASQVGLLRALFQDEELFNGLRLGGPDSVQLRTVDGSQGEENLVQIIDCVTMGGGANESMGFLGGEKRRFNVAMSRSKVGRIVICNREFIKGKHHLGPWKDFLEGDEHKFLDDSRFRQAWESGSMLEKFRSVRDTWIAKATAAAARQVGHSNELAPGNVEPVQIWAVNQTDLHWAATEFVRLTGASRAVAVALITAARGQMHVAIERYFQTHGDDGLGGVVEEIERMDL